MRRIPELRAFAKTLLMLLAFVFAAGAAAVDAQGQATMVIVVRHAEKVDDSGDPVLSDAGTARAVALADALTHADVQVVLTTQYQRTRLTGAVTAERAGITPQLVPAANPMQDHLRALADIVQANAGRTILIVGHSNTVPLIVRALGGPDIGRIEDSEYGDMFILTLVPDAPVKLVRAKY
ncbi:phosphoglycerate mutase family protein [soil metagenome]